MTPFSPADPDGGPPNPAKSVRYVEGMVLGVDDFQQEHVYLAALAGEALRLGAGVGTLDGLKVTAVRTADGKLEVHVGPGTAIDCRGRPLRVPEEQCADPVAWFATLAPADVIQAMTTAGQPASGAGTLPVRVTIAYVRTPTDAVPVPGEPCRGDAQLTAESRWLDDYRLDLSLAPAPAPRRDALRQYLNWTSYALAFTDAAPVDPKNYDAKADAAAALLLACGAAEKAASTGRMLPAKMPGGQSPVTMNKLDVELQAYCLDAAGVALVTDLLPTWLATQPAAGDPLLLAEFGLPVTRADANPTTPWALAAVASADALKMTSRKRPVALGGPALRVGPRLLGSA